MSSDISSCKLLGVGALSLGVAALAGTAWKLVVQQPVLALYPFAAYGAYKLISNNCMRKQSSKPIRNPSRELSSRESGRSARLAARRAFDPNVMEQEGEGEEEEEGAVHTLGRDERFARQLHAEINGSAVDERGGSDDNDIMKEAGEERTVESDESFAPAPVSDGKREVDINYQSKTDHRLASLWGYYDCGNLLQIPRKIKIERHGIENRENSCVLASFLYSFISTEKLDAMFLVDQFNDSSETTELRALLRDMVNDLRSDKQFVSGESLVKFREKLVYIDSEVLQVFREQGEDVTCLSMDTIFDSLKHKFGSRDNEFIKFSCDKAGNVHDIVLDYLAENNNTDWSKIQAFFVSISSKKECDFSRAKEISILGNEFELTSIVYSTGDHTVSYVLKNGKWYLFNSNRPQVDNLSPPKKIKDAYLIYTKKPEA